MPTWCFNVFWLNRVKLRGTLCCLELSVIICLCSGNSLRIFLCIRIIYTGMLAYQDDMSLIMPPFVLWRTFFFYPHCFLVYHLKLLLVSCLPGKWLMPITGRGGSPTTCTGSSAKTPASSIWNLQRTCGSKWIVLSIMSSSQTRRLLPMHNKALRKARYWSNIRVHG